MAVKSVARRAPLRAVPQAATPPAADAPTLADLTVSWRHGNFTFTLTGREIAFLITAATAGAQDGHLPSVTEDAGAWVHRLRGLGALIFPDAGVSVYEADSRAVLDDVLQWASGQLLAATLNSDQHAASFTVRLAPGSGRHGEAPERVHWHGSDTGAS